MSTNPFDNKIKESLENFEMPYDAAAWAELSQQLPAASGGSAASGFAGWKAVALIAVIATTVATAWYFNQDQEVVSEDAVAIEQPTHDDIQMAVEQVTVPSEDITLDKNDLPSADITSENESKADVVENIESSTVSESKSKLRNTESEPSRSEKSTTASNDLQPSNIEVEKPKNDTKESAKPLVAKFLASSVTVCVGEDVSFINECSDKTATMSWDMGDGTSNSDSDPVHSYVQPGTYLVRLTANNSKSSSDHSVTVTVNPTPTPIFSAERKLNGFEAIPLYQFSTAVLPSETALWSFSDGSRIQGNSAEHLFRDAGNGTAKLTVTNAYGCSSTMDQSYQNAKDFDLLTPDAFTPNGDGINETFIPKAIPDMNVAFEMSIQNPRTGQIVYRTSNALEPWNGKMNNVDPKLEAGVYIWTVVIKDNILNNKVFNGKINLQR